jgi:hypothetical protein
LDHPCNSTSGTRQRSDRLHVLGPGPIVALPYPSIWRVAISGCCREAGFASRPGRVRTPEGGCGEARSGPVGPCRRTE